MALHCYTRWTVTYDCAAETFNTATSSNQCIDSADAMTDWTIVDTSNFTCEYQIDVQIADDCDGCDGLAPSAEPSLPNPSTCGCPATRCYTRWTIQYNCGDSFTNLQGNNLCLNPSDAITSWSKTGSGSNYCIYTLDVELTGPTYACNSDADCSGRSQSPQPGPPTDVSDCPCPSTRCFTRWTVRYRCGYGFGAMSSESVCIDSASAQTSWHQTGAGEFYCDYAIDVDGDAVCTSSGECSISPPNPTYPDTSDCACPSTRCYTQWRVRYDCASGFGMMNSTNVCIDPGSAYTTWTVVDSGNFYCDYMIHMPVGDSVTQVCGSDGDCTSLSPLPPSPSTPDTSTCTCPATRCYTRWRVRHNCGCGIQPIDNNNICIDPAAAHTSWTAYGSGNYYCDYMIDVPLNGTCNNDGDCTSPSPQPPNPSTPDTSDCSCPSTRCYTEWTVHYDCNTGLGTMNSRNVCIDPSSAQLTWTKTQGLLACDYLIHVPLQNCIDHIDGVCTDDGDCAGSAPPSPSGPDTDGCDCSE